MWVASGSGSKSYTLILSEASGSSSDLKPDDEFKELRSSFLEELEAFVVETKRFATPNSNQGLRTTDIPREYTSVKSILTKTYTCVAIWLKYGRIPTIQAQETRDILSESVNAP